MVCDLLNSRWSYRPFTSLAVSGVKPLVLAILLKIYRRVILFVREEVERGRLVLVNLVTQ